MPLRFLIVLIVFVLCTPAEPQQQEKIPRIGYPSTGAHPRPYPKHSAKVYASLVTSLPAECNQERPELVSLD